MVTASRGFPAGYDAIAYQVALKLRERRICGCEGAVQPIFDKVDFY